MICKASAPSPLAGEVAAERPEGGRADTSGISVFARPPPPTPAPQGGGGSESGASQCA